LDCFGGQLDCGVEGVGGFDLHVGGDAGAFPIGVGDGVDGAGEGNADHEVIVDAMGGDGMGASAGAFTDDSSALLRLEIVGKFLCAGEGAVCSEDKCGLAGKRGAGHVGKGPILGGRVFLAVVEIV